MTKTTDETGAEPLVIVPAVTVPADYPDRCAKNMDDMGFETADLCRTLAVTRELTEQYLALVASGRLTDDDIEDFASNTGYRHLYELVVNDVTRIVQAAAEALGGSHELLLAINALNAWVEKRDLADVD